MLDGAAHDLRDLTARLHLLLESLGLLAHGVLHQLDDLADPGGALGVASRRVLHQLPGLLQLGAAPLDCAAGLRELAGRHADPAHAEPHRLHLAGRRRSRLHLLRRGVGALGHVLSALPRRARNLRERGLGLLDQLRPLARTGRALQDRLRRASALGLHRAHDGVDLLRARAHAVGERAHLVAHGGV